MGLDAVGTRMWTVLVEAASIQQAYEFLLDEYDVDAEQLRCHLLEFIGELEQNGLIEIRHDGETVP
jgi:Coenzyme PQQ synthesis protein D (PqqD)